MFFPNEKKKVDLAHRSDLDKNAVMQISKQEREKRKLVKQQAEAAQLIQQYSRGKIARLRILKSLELEERVPKIVHEISALLQTSKVAS